MNSWVRVTLPATLILIAGVFLYSRGQPERLPPRSPLDLFPAQLSEWQGSDLAIAKDVREILGDGEFLQRIYHRKAEEPPINLFVAYFPTQRTGSTIHSPQNCLPGSGWTPVESSRVELIQPGGGKMTVNRYLIAKDLDRLLVLYWYQSHGRIVASEYWAKVFLVTDAIRLNRSDGALIRVITPIKQEETPADAQKRETDFIEQALPQFDHYIPR